MKKYWSKCLVIMIMFSVITSVIVPSVSSANNHIIANGIGSSHSLALKDAMRNAIEQKVGILVDSTTIVKNARILEDNIYMHAEGFIRSYDILEENVINGYYNIKIKAIVDNSLQTQLMTKLQKIKIIETGLEDPRIGIMLAASNTSDITSEAVENLIIKCLGDNGFSRIMDMKQINAVKKNQALYMSISGQDQEAMALMTQFDTDYMIVGNIRPMNGTRVLDGMFTSCKVAIDVRLYNVNTAQISFADTIVGTGMAVDKNSAELRAIEEATNHIGMQLSNSLLKTASVPKQNLRILVNTNRDIDSVKNALEYTEGIERVYFRSSRGKLMTFDVKFIGNSMLLANGLRKQGFSILDVTSGSINVGY